MPNVTPSLTTIADSNVGTATFTLTVTYGEAMNTSISPTITFPAENPNNTLTLNAGQSGWTNITTYVVGTTRPTPTRPWPT